MPSGYNDPRMVVMVAAGLALVPIVGTMSFLGWDLRGREAAHPGLGAGARLAATA